MNYNDSIKKVLVGLIILVAAAAVITVIASMFMKSSPQTAEQINTVAPKDITKTEVDKGKDPAKFPSGVPIEAGAAITQNYNATAVDGRFQATKAFVTAKSLADNLALYQKYMKENGWDVQSTVNQDNYKMVFGVKGNTNLQVSMDNNTTTTEKTVTISYTENPVPKAQ